MKPHQPDNDKRDKGDASKPLGHFRPLSLSQDARPTESFIPAHGGYESLLSFQKARIVYDGTVRFAQIG